MKKLLIISFILFYSCISASEILLEGIFKQGGFFSSILPKDVIKAKFNDKQLIIYKDHIFVGLSRNQKLKNEIIFVLQNGDTLRYEIEIEKQNYFVQKIRNMAKKYVEKPKNKKLEKRINKEYKKITEVRNKIIYRNKRMFFSRFNLPLVYKVTGVFGSGRIYNNKKSGSYHKGVDFAAPKGANVYSCASGIVVLTGDYFFNGKFVLIDHGLGLSSIYIHLSKISVLPGQFVEIGEKIGEVGSSGKAVGAHLHWGVYWYEQSINPLFLTKSIKEKKILKY